MDVQFPNVSVDLVGENGNIFNLMGVVCRAMKKAGCSNEQMQEFKLAVTSAGSYDEALRIIMRTVNVE